MRRGSGGRKAARIGRDAKLDVDHVRAGAAGDRGKYGRQIMLRCKNEV